MIGGGQFPSLYLASLVLLSSLLSNDRSIRDRFRHQSPAGAGADAAKRPAGPTLGID